NAASGATHVVDDDRLTEGRPHALRQNPRDHIGRAARRIGYNQGDWTRGIHLSQCISRMYQGSGKGERSQDVGSYFHIRVPVSAPLQNSLKLYSASYGVTLHPARVCGGAAAQADFRDRGQPALRPFRFDLDDMAAERE